MERVSIKVFVNAAYKWRRVARYERDLYGGLLQPNPTMLEARMKKPGIARPF
jgi:hypothetical protein